jgi:acyl-CoA synthetase (AMP-forming)/AMP-acid ligase II
MTAQTVYDAIRNTASEYPERAVLHIVAETAKTYDIRAGDITYSKFIERTDQLAYELKKNGYDAGMRVAVLLENRPDFFIIFAALNKIGASIVPINPDLRAAELEYLFDHASPALIISTQTRQTDLSAASQNCGLNAPVCVFGKDPLPPLHREDAVVATCETGDAVEAAVLYTSGTTGKPKGCVLSNAYFLLAGRWYAKLGGIANLSTQEERMITPLPIFHMNAMAYSFMSMVTVGGCLIALDRFHPKTWWNVVSESRATCLHYLGVMPTILMSLPSNDLEQKHRVRFGFGAGVDPKLQQDFETRFGFPLIEAWAMTETGAGAVISAHTHDRLIGRSCLGSPEGWVDTRIIDNDGNDVLPNTPGELLVRNNGNDPKYGFFTEYYKDPDATAEAWINDWFHTGDIVQKDAAGRIYFVDRKKNIIRRSSENIAAVEVESMLNRHPKIRAVAVCGVPDTLRGDEVFACIVTDAPKDGLAQNIATWALDQMAYYKVPGYIAFVDALPLTTTQKIQRKELQNLALRLLERNEFTSLIHLKKRQVNT